MQNKLNYTTESGIDKYCGKKKEHHINPQAVRQ